jgi:hypothetical protein
MRPVGVQDKAPATNDPVLRTSAARVPIKRQQKSGLAAASLQLRALAYQ